MLEHVALVMLILLGHWEAALWVFLICNSIQIVINVLVYGKPFVTKADRA